MRAVSIYYRTSTNLKYYNLSGVPSNSQLTPSPPLTHSTGHHDIEQSSIQSLRIIVVIDFLGVPAIFVEVDLLQLHLGFVDHSILSLASLLIVRVHLLNLDVVAGSPYPLTIPHLGLVVILLGLARLGVG